MYIFTDWDFKKNFEIDHFTGLMTKTSTTSGIWDARAYRKDVFTELKVNAGIRVFHNLNPAESTDYAVGISNDEPMNLVDPSDIQFGFRFHAGLVDIIDNLGIVNQFSTNNSEYTLEFQSDGTMNAFEDGVLIHSSSTVVDFTVPFNLVMFASIAQSTDLEAQIDLTGIKCKHVTDVTYIDGFGTEISLYLNPYNTPTNLRTLTVQTDAPVLENSINSNSVKLFRFVPAFEDVEEYKEEIEIIAPYNWDTSNHFDIYIPGFEEGYVYELMLGTIDDPLISHTSWGQMIHEIDNYDALSDAEFIDLVFTTILQRNPTPTEITEWENSLGSGTSRTTMIHVIVDSIEYQSSPMFASGIPFENKLCIFKSYGEEPAPSDVDLSQFFNDIYYKARNLDALVNVDKIVFDLARMFNYQYKVTEYDADLNEYHYVTDEEKKLADLDDTDTVLTFDNAKIIEELFVKQYLPEYQRYVNDINNPDISVLLVDERQKMKDLLFKNITLMNYFKGNEGQMQHLVSIFSTSIGYYYVSVDPDPYYNFIYRVSTTLPKKYWLNDMKHITHPLGWEDFYVLVPTDANAWHQMKTFDTMESFEEYWEKYGNFPDRMYADINYFTDEEGKVYRFGRYIGNAMYEEMYETKEFPFKYDDYSANVNYNTQSAVTDIEGSVFHDLRAEFFTFNIVKDYDTDAVEEFELEGTDPLFSYTNNGYSWSLEFRRSGVAAEYIWDIYTRGAKIGTIKTHIPKLTYIGQPNEYYDIVLRLKYKNCLIPIYNYRISNEPIKFQNSVKDGVSKCDAYLDQLVSSTVDRHDAMMVGDSGSEKEYPIEDGHYDSILDFALVGTIIPGIVINSNANIHEVFFNDTAGTENLIQGIFIEYEWTISNTASSRVINKFRTNTASIFCDLTGVTVSVSLIRGEDDIFVGPSINI